MIVHATLAFLSAPSNVERLARALADNTFSGIHRLDWFDYLLLVPYFTFLAILAIYGAHRYLVIKRYLQHRKRVPTCAAPALRRTAPGHHPVAAVQ
jgi:hypothetical protein